MRSASSFVLLACAACSSGTEGDTTSTAAGDPTTTAGPGGGSTATGGGSTTSTSGNGGGGSTPEPCTTRIDYGERWIRPPNHPLDYDVVPGLVTWDGACASDGASSYATLSNGFQPYFAGLSGCTVSLHASGDCGVPLGDCASRIAYGPSWLPPPNHPTTWDDVPGVVFGDGSCISKGGGVVATALSNGWAPHFNGACQTSFRYTQCGGLYRNPVVPSDCPDPSVTRDGDDYYLVCTKSVFGGLYTIHHSTDLLAWAEVGYVFQGAGSPTWAVSDFWAPELHRVGTGWVAYYSARDANGRLAIGAATASTPLGPYTDLGQPLVEEASVGQIDAHAFEDESGTRYLVWKDDGNAFGQPTPIWGQALAANGVERVGPKVKLLQNDRPWEGALVEGPWIERHGGSYYLFYSGNAYYDARYAVGVARSASPLGPYEKRGDPILATRGAFAGPGHGSVVRGPRGDDLFVHHAWLASSIGGPPGRVVLVERIQWGADGWPGLFAAPSSDARPLP
jgi:arabinan endo-1,5-alpha-L-arabinosidase